MVIVTLLKLGTLLFHEGKCHVSHVEAGKLTRVFGKWHVL